MAEIDVYAICWNEERLLPYFLRHYGAFARRIVLFDNHSTDCSRRIAQEHPLVELRSFGSAGATCGEAERMPVRQAAWQQSRRQAEWVMVVDCDEFVWHPNLIDYLDECRRRGVTVPRPTGFEMVSEDFPSGAGQIYQHVRRGLPVAYMNKWLIFDPDAIECMNWLPGCHQAFPTGNVVFDDDPALKLLHFKRLGVEYLASRFRQLEQRRTAHDRAFGLNHHYAESSDDLATWMKQALADAHEVVPPG